MRWGLKLIAITSAYATLSVYRWVWPQGYHLSLLEKNGGELEVGVPDSIGHSKQSETAIIMYDTRLLDVEGDYTYWRWAAELNFFYAKRHKYDFIYNYGTNNNNDAEVSLETDNFNSVYKMRPQCTLRRSGKEPVHRGASWCKLLAVSAALQQGYRKVVMIDSDAYFKTDAPSLDVILENHGGKTSLKSQSPIVWFANDVLFWNGGSKTDVVPKLVVLFLDQRWF